MQSYSVSAQRACVQCGTVNSTKFCGECGALVAGEPESARQILRESVAELVGVDAGVPRTLRDLVLRPVDVVRSYWTGNPAGYTRPFKLFFVLAGVYLLLMSVFKPYVFDWEQIVSQQPASTVEAVHRLMANQGVTAAMVNERFQQWMNTAMPLVSALMMVPLAMVLRRKNRSQPLANHLMFMVSITNSMWVVCILISPVMLLGPVAFTIAAQLVGITMFGLGIFGLYPARTRLRSVLRLAGFLAVNLVMTALFVLPLQFVLLMAALLV
jgi:hypothetical protein